MVGKLMKHELKAILRHLVYVAAIALAFSVLARIAVAIDMGMFFSLSLLGAIAAIVVVVCWAFIGSVTRFSQSLFTGEGYMTFSLPATPSQILTAKLLSAFIVMLASYVLAAVCAMILLTGISADVWASISETLGEYAEYLAVYFSSDPLLLVEMIVNYIVGLPLGLLFVYSGVCIGQLANKHRKLITVAVLIGALYAFPLVETYAIDLPLSLMNLESSLYGHIYYMVYILVDLALDAGMFFFIRYIMLHKVNLIV